jgi:hypothetical protein
MTALFSVLFNPKVLASLAISAALFFAWNHYIGLREDLATATTRADIAEALAQPDGRSRSP